MSAPRPTASRALGVGALLVVLGLASWAFYVQRSRSEPHAYSRGGKPPATVRLVAGDTYTIAIHDGVRREIALGLDPAALQCSAARAGEAAEGLELTTQSQDSKAVNDIATFVSRMSGDVQVQCTGIGAVYVDDAADSPFDWSGLWLVLASLALLIGLPLTISALRGTVVPREIDDDADDRPYRDYGELDLDGVARTIRSSDESTPR